MHFTETTTNNEINNISQCNGTEAYQLYKMKHGENVGHPTSCSVGFKNTTQCVRQCKYHSNMILMLESLHKKVPMIPLYSRREFLPLCVCRVDDEDCMSSQCEDCMGKFEENITNNISDEVSYSSIKWEENDGYLAPTVHTGTVLQCLQALQAQLPQFLWHAYIKQKQADSYEAHNTVGERTAALQIIARCSITQTPTGQWSIENVAD